LWIEDPPSVSRFLPEDSIEGAHPAKPAIPRVALLVEDSPTDVFVIKEALARTGLDLTVRVARDGEEALRYLREIAGNEKTPCPALVLLDLNLPKVAGFEVLKELRAKSRCQHTPVIVVTSSKTEQDRFAARRLGADEYFQKPKDLTEYMDLARLVRRVLGAPE
jgi:DNA-binding response OmpR family regulator